MRAAEPVSDYVSDLGEGPCWLPGGRLSWVDVLLGRVLVGEPDAAGLVHVVARHAPGLHVSAALPLASAADGWIIAAGAGFAHLRSDGTLTSLAQPEAPRGGLVRMNDAGCDPLGRLWAGSMAYDERPGAGSLFRVDLDGTVTRIREGLQISNGIDWSPDGSTFYFNDSGHGIVYSAPYDLERGELGELQPLITPEGPGVPDGLTVDAEGMLWVAFWGGARVDRLAPDGRLVERITVGAPHTTSCCLGGSDGATLYITGARRGMTAAQLRRYPDAGRLFAVPVQASGPPARPFLGVLPQPDDAAGAQAATVAPRDPADKRTKVMLSSCAALASLRLDPATATLPASARRFPDGGAYRLEIPSVESLAALEAVIDEATLRYVPIHRVSQGSGVALLSDSEISEMLAACESAGIELCLFLLPRASWTHGGGRASSAGTGGARARGADQLRESLLDAERACELGVRCLLVADEGVLWALHELRAAGELPQDVTLKMSALSAPLNPAAFALLERIGADSINVHSDLTVAQIAELRSAATAAIDLYVESPDDLGGFVRVHEAPELVRIGAPIYLKFGLRNSPPLYPVGGHLAPVAVATARERVRRTALCLELMARAGVAQPPSPVPARRPPDGASRFPSGALTGKEALA